MDSSDFFLLLIDCCCCRWSLFLPIAAVVAEAFTGRYWLQELPIEIWVASLLQKHTTCEKITCRLLLFRWFQKLLFIAVDCWCYHRRSLLLPVAAIVTGVLTVAIDCRNVDWNVSGKFAAKEENLWKITCRFYRCQLLMLPSLIAVVDNCCHCHCSCYRPLLIAALPIDVRGSCFGLLPLLLTMFVCHAVCPCCG